MQDWDFPHFTNTLDVNLPGFYKHMVTFQAVEIQISGTTKLQLNLLLSIIYFILRQIYLLQCFNNHHISRYF